MLSVHITFKMTDTFASYPNVEMLSVRNFFFVIFLYNIDFTFKKLNFAMDAFDHSPSIMNKLNRLFLSSTRVLHVHIDNVENGIVECFEIYDIWNNCSRRSWAHGHRKQLILPNLH